jgi:nitroreductase
MDPLLLRTLLRERVHHTVECRLYPAVFGGAALKREGMNTALRILKIWDERGLPSDAPDIAWARNLIQLFDQAVEGKTPSFEGRRPEPFNEHDLGVVERVIFTRRSYRQWTDEPVPDRMLQRILKAATWAPTGCDLQVVRYIVVTKPETLARFPAREFAGETAKIIICVDKRAYDIRSATPKRNQILDCGAAAQNILLMAHALGLGAVWSTFNDREIANVRSYFELPDYIDVVTYVSLGFAAEAVLPPGRMDVSDYVIREA